MGKISSLEINIYENVTKFASSKTEIEYEKSFQSILTFYLFKCPATKYKNKKGTKWKASSRSKQFHEYGLEKEQLFRLLHYMKQQVDIRFVENFNNGDTTKEQFVHLKARTDMSRVSSIFYNIRNAFAHGSFGIHGDFYFFNFARPGKDEIKGYGKIKRETLLDWIDVIESGKILESQNRKKKKGK